jgi:hypothetical protein
MKTGGMRLEEALAFLKERRAIVQPNDSFITQLEVSLSVSCVCAVEARRPYKSQPKPTS